MGKINNKTNVTKKKNIKSKGMKNARCNYNKEDLKLAVAEASGGMKVAELARKYNIPESTIRARKMNKYQDKKPGPSTILSEEDENKLVEWIFYCCRQGFPVSKQKLVDNVKFLCDHSGRKTSFVDNKPGRAWLEGFLRRHPSISERVSENLSLTRAKVSELQIRGWFSGITDYYSEFFTEEEFLKIGPERIFNGDEIGVSLNPKPPAVLAPKGTKNVYNVVGSNEKGNVTVLVTANAAGDLAPTLLLFAGQSVPKDVIKVGPPNFSFGHSENGWMTAKNFYEYITNVFFPWVVDSKIKLPIILYIDGHCSHITLPLSKFCSENKIILVALYPNATHILQPLDVALFRTFRAAYRRSFEALCHDSGTISIKKCQVAHVLKKTFESLDLKKILENGFKTCGLHPLNVNAIDFSKVFKKDGNLSSDTQCTSEEVINTPKDSAALKVIESLIDKDKLVSFRAHNSSVWRGKKEDKSLYDIWFKLNQSNGGTNADFYTVHDSVQEPNISQTDETEQPLSEMMLLPIVDDPEANLSEHVLDYDKNGSEHTEWHSDLVKNDVVELMFNLDGELIASNTQNQKSFSTLTTITANSRETQNPSTFGSSSLNNQNVVSTLESVSGSTLINAKSPQPQNPFTPAASNPSNQATDSALESDFATIIAKSPQSQDPFTPAASSPIHRATDSVVQSTSDSATIAMTPQSQNLSTPAASSLNIQDSDSTPASSALLPIQPSINTINIQPSSVNAPDDLPFANITNTDPCIEKFTDPFKKLLHWPKPDLSNRNKRRRNNKTSIPSVLSSTQWQSIQEQKETDKQRKAEETILKKKIKIEERENKKKELEKKRVSREEEKLKKEKIKLEKEKEKFEKQQQKIKEAEEKQKLKEEGLLKKLKAAEIKKKIAELEAAELELQKQINNN